MGEHANVDRLRRAYRAFAAGDVAGVLAGMAPDAVFHSGGDGPLSGDHKGHEAIVGLLAGSARLTGGTQRLDVTGIFADDSHGVVVVHETAARAGDGATLDMPEVHLVAFDGNGAITDFWDIPSDPAAHDAFFDGG